jgi:hypothetical protein
MMSLSTSLEENKWTTTSSYTLAQHYLTMVRQVSYMYAFFYYDMATYMTFAASNTLSPFLSLTKVLSSKGFVKISANCSSDLTP